MNLSNKLPTGLLVAGLIIRALADDPATTPGPDAAQPHLPMVREESASQTFDYLIQHCTVNPPNGINFWRNPDDGGVDNDRWQGAQALQTAVISYEVLD